MPPTRQTHAANDPFTDAPLRHPTIAPPNLRAAASASASHHALRSNASTASSRSRQQKTNLFAPALSRRPTSRRATPAFEEDVLADEVEEDAEELDAALQRRQVRHARARHASPESKLARAQQKARLEREREREEESDFVIRKADGSYWREVEGLEGCLAMHLQAEEMLNEAEVKAMDDMHSATVGHYFKTVPVTGSRANEKHERSFEDHFPAVASRVRQLALSKLEHEKWRYESVSSY